MTEKIKTILELMAEKRREIERLDREFLELQQQHLASIAIAQIGDIIKFKRGNMEARGKVYRIFEWCSDVGDWVDLIRKDGSVGSKVKVYPYSRISKESP